MQFIKRPEIKSSRPIKFKAAASYNGNSVMVGLRLREINLQNLHFAKLPIIFVA
jgi:hypothetical protein